MHERKLTIEDIYPQKLMSAIGIMWLFSWDMSGGWQDHQDTDI
jgi:hypothetical protein